MSFLPIVQRELRAAARRRNTFRVRWWAALIALGLTLLWTLMMTVSRAGSVGSSVFGLLTGYAFGLSLLAGVVLTADSLTEEKRDGTLGLLFLTPLKGYDVVLGKLIAQSLMAFYCLLALLPITALPLLLGGVEGAEFWRTALALTNALFFSMAAGICVSTFMRDSQRAMGNTLGLVLLSTACLPLLGNTAISARLPAVLQKLPWFSPLLPFSHASEVLYARHAETYWGSLGCSQLFAWSLLATASVSLPLLLRERAPAQIRSGGRRPRAVSPRQIRRRHRLLDQNPVQWLRSDELRTPWPAWFVALAWLGTAAAFALLGKATVTPILAYIFTPFSFLIKVLFAAQACRFFVEGRANGSLELLLCTPLSDRQVIAGQMRSLWKAFAGPLAILVIGLFVPAILRGVLLMRAGHLEPIIGLLGGAVLAAVQLVRLAADLFALQWMGMALALTGKRPRLALALTILWVLVLPSVFVFCWLDALIDIIFISWGSTKCRQNLRRLVAEQYQARAV